MSHKFRRKGSELLDHMAALCRRTLVERLGVAETAAAEIAREYVHEVAVHFGGQLFYLPRDLALTLSRRDRKIYEEFRGDNIDELARRYGLTSARIYEIMRRYGQEQQSRVQSSLPGLDDSH